MDTHCRTTGRFEPPSPASRWIGDRLRDARSRRCVDTITHAAGLLHRDAELDRRLRSTSPPHPGRDCMGDPEHTSKGRRIIAIGTTVVRALSMPLHG